MRHIRFLTFYLSIATGVFTLSAEAENRNSSLPDTIPALPQPLIAPHKDIFTTSAAITLSNPCSSACCKKSAILYTTDGTDPRESSTVSQYQYPFNISESVTITAYIKAADACRKDSDLITKKYSLIEPLPLPSILPKKGRIAFGEKITIFIKNFETDTTILIFYTLDGSDPSTAGTRYKEPFALNKSSILRAIAVSQTGVYLNSPIFYRKFTCYLTLSPQPLFSPLSTNFENKLIISLMVPGFEDDDNVKIYYSDDDSRPTIFSIPYINPITVSETVTIKAIAVRKGYRPSKTVCEQYIQGPQKVAPQPQVLPEGGIFGGGIPPVTFTNSLKKAMVMYTLDETEPTLASNLWDGKSLQLSTPATLKVKVFRSDWVPSVTVTEKYDYEILPEPISNFPSGTVFTDALVVTLRIPGFRNEQGLKILYTLDGSKPVVHSNNYDAETDIPITKSCVLKAYAQKRGYYDSRISTYEFFNMIRVVHAFYQDQDHDGKIETAVLLFDKELNTAPSLIEFTDPFTFNKHKIIDCRIISSQDHRRNCALITFNTPFGPGGGFSSGHYGRIPLPGEFDTAPFLIHDSTGTSPLVERPWKKKDTFNIHRLHFDTKNSAVINNPFTPQKSVLPEFIQDINEFRTATGSAVLIKPLHPSEGSAVICDALGNTVIVQKQLIEDPVTGILFLVWDGKNSKRHSVEKGTYLVAITTKEKQSRETTTRRITLTVKD